MTGHPDRGSSAGPWRWRATHRTATGAKHVSAGIECQDCSTSGSFRDGRWVYAIVADGHGSAPHFRSGRGAEFAVRALRETFWRLPGFLDDVVSEQGDEIRAVNNHWAEVGRHVVLGWRRWVNEDLLRDPPRVPEGEQGERGLERFLEHVAKARGFGEVQRLFEDMKVLGDLSVRHHGGAASSQAPAPAPLEVDTCTTSFAGWSRKAYGTTLLGVLIGPSALHWVGIGDGAMIKIVGGRAEYLVPPPEEAVGDVTPSLCDDDAVLGVQTGTVPIGPRLPPAAIVLTTDGVPNSYDHVEGFAKFCTDIVAGVDRPRELTENLGRWLPEISQRGSGDDMSVALAWLVESGVPPEDAIGTAESVDDSDECSTAVGQTEA